MRVLAAADKFKGTATAGDVCAAIARGVGRLGVECTEVPMADGGEGTLEALGGANRDIAVMGPLGDPVVARWRLDQGTAVIEMAEAAGLTLAGGSEGNDPLNATTRGVGELIDHAIDAGATRVIIGVGGSATTDGGLGALEAMDRRIPEGVDITVACDVRTLFIDAAEVFGPQKGASVAETKLLTARLGALRKTYIEEFGVDVGELPRSGAAGGLAGGLAAMGASLVDGLDLVAGEVDLVQAVSSADVVMTGEGFLDPESFNGKVVGGVAAVAAELGKPVIAIAGQVHPEIKELPTASDHLMPYSLTDRFGLEQAMSEPVRCIEDLAEEAVRPLLG